MSTIIAQVRNDKGEIFNQHFFGRLEYGQSDIRYSRAGDERIMTEKQKEKAFGPSGRIHRIDQTNEEHPLWDK